MEIGKILSLVFVLLCIIGGVIWYNHNLDQKRILLAEQRNKERLLQIEKLEKNIISLNNDIIEKQKELDENVKKPEIIEKEWLEVNKKKDEINYLIRSLNNEINDLNRKERNNSINSKEKKSEIISIEIMNLKNTIENNKRKINELDCHYNCMKHSTRGDKIKSSDYGYWSYNERYHQFVWMCKKHKCIFLKKIEYLDYKNECIKLNTENNKINKRIASLNIDLENEKSNEQKNEINDNIFTKNNIADTNNKIIEQKSNLREIELEEKKILNRKRETENLIYNLNQEIKDKNKEIDNCNDKINELKIKKE